MAKLTCICICQRVTYFMFHCGGIFMGHLLSVKGWVSWVPNHLSLLMFIVLLVWLLGEAVSSMHVVLVIINLSPFV